MLTVSEHRKPLQEVLPAEHPAALIAEDKRMAPWGDLTPTLNPKKPHAALLD